MFMLETMILLSAILAVVVLALAYLLAMKPFWDNEKLSPFECGFLPYQSTRSPFSMHFFLIALVFLIFDVELILLFPLFLSPLKMITSVGIFLTIMLILTAGAFLEWSQKMLDWVNLK